MITPMLLVDAELAQIRHNHEFHKEGLSHDGTFDHLLGVEVHHERGLLLAHIAALAALATEPSP